ncbi:MAG TPA: protein kinase [Terriglobales bacterium]
MSPTRIGGRYELQDQLGEGGMGVVWRALDVRIGSYVAVKLMKDVSDPVAVDFFSKEWKTLAEISHPNIVDVRDVGVIEEKGQTRPFFVMPLLRGATLAELISNASVRLTVARIIEITTQVCRGLQVAHQHGLIHRDLKPSNIFVMEDDTAKIIDFGVVHLAGSKSLTGMKGTFQYMSPEQAQLKEITPASDLFSVGVILYEALTLRKPFARASVEETIEAVVKLIPPPVSEINPGVEQSISQVVHKCLAKRPIHRFASARELAETLQKAFRNEPVFDAAKIVPRIERARGELKSGDPASASEILAELEAEGHLDPRITVLRTQIDLSVKERKIRKLLETAHARMEQEEIPLALDKLRDVLELDPQNADALAMRELIKKQSSEAQIAKWFELAQTHLSNRDFDAARHAAREVLAIRLGDRRALDMLENIESTESEARRVREQKEQLYSSALRAYQNGEIESALSKLERLFSVARANPNADVPQRDAVYQNFYKEVRSEHDSIGSAMEEAQRQFAEKDFAGAMAVCQELITKYPNDPTFQALKIRIEDAERQGLSAYIAEVSKLVESEPDLDRRANLLKEACERYPSEVHFAQQLKLARQRRDLVNSIVAKARQYEEKGQYAEAMSQWDILRNIHPQYPGIAFELQECRKKRDRQAREEEHARLVEEIDALVGNRNYEQAIARVDLALRDFPGDAELCGLRVLAEQSLQRTKESRRLFEDGQQALAENDLVRATELLRSGFRLDPRAPGLRETLVNIVTERARSLVDDNLPEAEPLYQEANQLDSNHPAVRALRSSIAEAKRQSFVGQCLAECRNLVADGSLQAAGERVRAARAQYPNDVRLEQYQASLEKEVSERSRKAERDKDNAVLSDDRRLLEHQPGRAAMRAVLERSYGIRAKHPDDPEIGKGVAEIELAIRHLSGSDDLSELLHNDDVQKGKTKLFSQLEGGGNGGQAAAKQPEIRAVPSKPWNSRERYPWSLAAGAAAIIVVLIAAIGLYVRHRQHTQPPVEVQLPKPSIAIKVTPPDSRVMSDGKPVTAQSLAEGTIVEVSRLGYQTKRVNLRQVSDGNIALEPEPARLSIQTSEKDGQVELDGASVAELSNGSLDNYILQPDDKDHLLSVLNKGRRLFTLGFHVSPGSAPKVTTFNGNNLFVIASLGTGVKLYGPHSGPGFQFGEQNIASDPSGMNLDITETDREIKFGQGSEQGSLLLEILNAPALLVHSLTGESRLIITTNAEHPTLTLDGTALQSHKGQWVITGVTGQHQFEISAPNYQTQSWTTTLQRGQTISKNLQLLPTPVLPKLATLVIRGGTPGAEVDLDGTRLGVLDGNGNFEQPGLINNGQHTVTMRKQFYEERRSEITSSNPSSDVRLSNIRLVPWSTLGFQTTVSSAKVRFRRAGDSQFHEVSASAKTQLPPGSYEIVANAPGYEGITTNVTLAGEDVLVPLNFAGIKDYEFLDPNQITRDGGWVKAKNKDVSLRPGLLNVTVTFTHPGKAQFGNKKVEWFIVAANGHARVHYILEGQRLRRKLEGYNSTEETEVVVNLKAENGKDVAVATSVEGNRIRIANYAHAVQDDYTVPDQNFVGGTIVVRPGSDIPFVVRR